MKFIKFLFILCILSIILNACSTLKESGRVLRNEKTKTTDEFLIKKKEPLTQPPDFETIPVPGSIENEVEEQNSIEKILKTSQPQSGISQSKSSSTEEFILNQIKK
jgi:hypothetical protein